MNFPSPLDDYRWLTSDDASRWLRSVAEDQEPLLSQAGRLRRQLSAGRVHLLLQQVELRRRARAKFARADRMFFTPIGLEQATDQFVARYKASRFPQNEALADLCCGIGGDLLALAGRGPAVGVDRDPVAALLAEANLRALGLTGPGRPNTQVRVEDVGKLPVSDYAAWHLDPDRRAQGRRTTAIQRYEPALPTIRRLLHQRADAAVKLAPAADPPEDWTQRAELEWISRRKQCRQVVAWFGRLAQHPGRRRATILGSEQSNDPGVIRTLIGTQETRPPVATEIGRYVFDPDPAVLAAGLLGALAAEHHLAALGLVREPAGDCPDFREAKMGLSPCENGKLPLDKSLLPGVAYLTGHRPVTDPALACFAVTDVLPLDLKRLKRLLTDRGIGELEIKKRGVSHDVEALRRRLHLRGDKVGVLLLAPVARTVTAILARRT